MTERGAGKSVIASCGCLALPEAIAVLGPEVHCSRHGWVGVDRRATPWEVIGIKAPEAFGDVPLF